MRQARWASFSAVLLLAASVAPSYGQSSRGAAPIELSWLVSPVAPPRDLIRASTKDKSACIDKCNGDSSEYNKCYSSAKTVKDKYACDPLYDKCRIACDKILCDPADRDAKVVESCANYTDIQKDLAKRARANTQERLDREKAEKEKAQKEKAKADQDKADKAKAEQKDKVKADKAQADKAKADKAKADKEKADKDKAGKK